jgi:membrane-associated phospholipid phosphatase
MSGFTALQVIKQCGGIMDSRKTGAKVSVSAAQLVSMMKKRRSFILTLFLIFSALAFLPLDRAVSDLVRNLKPEASPIITEFKDFTSFFRGFGKGDVIIMLAFLLGFCGYKQRAIAVICALLITGMLVWPLKVSIARERPRGNSHVSFPSGDTASAASFAEVLASGAPLLVPVAAVTVASVGAGRVLVLAHYSSDVLAGMAVGIIAGIIGLRLSRRYAARFQDWHFFVLFVLFVIGDAAYCAATHSQSELSRFLEIYGVVIFSTVAMRILLLFARYRNSLGRNGVEYANQTQSPLSAALDAE